MEKKPHTWWKERHEKCDGVTSKSMIIELLGADEAKEFFRWMIGQRTPARGGFFTSDLRDYISCKKAQAI